ncbi:MAG: hypothetical protein ACI9TH_003497 [Kiritimatiellia bacterium]
MIRRVRDDFVALALKAGKVARGGSDPERRLYAELKRTSPVPQGIAVLHYTGEVISWVLSFDDEAGIPAFFDSCYTICKEQPKGALAFTKRYRSYPSVRLADVPARGPIHDLPAMHANTEKCPAADHQIEGSMLIKVYGRAIDEAGEFKEDTRAQENYVEDRFQLEPDLSQGVLEAAHATKRSFSLPEAFSRLLVANAYLGHLDVNPIGGNGIRAETTHDAIKLRGQIVEQDAPDRLVIRVEGSSSVAGRNDASSRASQDGRKWRHAIDLDWQGVLVFKGDHLESLRLLASGSEELEWDNKRGMPANELANLPAGRRIDMKTRVRYGLTGDMPE